MKLLFDTHSFIWWHSQRAKLSPEVLKFCADPDNQLYLSVVTVWEIQIKHQIGKLELTKPIETIVEEQQLQNAVTLLPITLPHVLQLDSLPLHHRDPFDRLLIAQAQIEGLTVISHDSMFGHYSIKVVW